MAPAKKIAEEKMKEYKDEIIRPAIPTPSKSDNVASRGLKVKAPIVPHPPPLSSNLGKNSEKSSSQFGNRKPKSRRNIKQNESDTKKDDKAGKKQYGPSSWRDQGTFVSPRMRIPSKSERSDNSNATNDAFKLDETKRVRLNKRLTRRRLEKRS